MNLPPDFRFSQASLQDFTDCARRFQLRYVERVAWPALSAEPAADHERHLQAGERFHKLVHQALLGVSAARLEASLHDEGLRTWWRRFWAHAPALWDGGERPAAGHFSAEVELTAALGSFRLVARYDLVLEKSDGRLIIVDWKTGGRKPARAILAARLQTRVYPFVLVAAGGDLTGGRKPAPDQIEMVYWYAETPAEPERFAYSAELYERDRAYLLGLLGEMEHLEAADDLRTPNADRCRFCVYRSLCGRGVDGGPADEAGVEPASDESVLNGESDGFEP